MTRNHRKGWVPKSRKSNQGAPLQRGGTPKGVINRQAARDAQRYVAHMRSILAQSNPRLSLIELNMLIAQQLGLIKKK